MTTTSTASGTAGATDEGDVQPIVFLTNRYNLLEILAAGAITPREGYSKYYEDLLALAPGRVPLVRGPLSKALCELVMGGETDVFPVAIEIAPESLSGISKGMDKLGALLVRAPSGELTKNASSNDATIMALAPAQTIPLTAVIRAHFRSDGERREHERRSYENVPMNLVPLEVTPSLFHDGARGLSVDENIVPWLESLPAVAGGQAERFERADRIAGALTMVLSTLPGRGEHFEKAAALLNGAVHGNAPGQATPGAKRKSSKTATKRSGSPGPSRRPVLPDWLATLTMGGDVSNADLETRLFHAALTVLTGITRSSGWRPVEILGAVDKKMREGKLSKAEENTLTPIIAGMRAILRNERELQPFKADTGLEVAKALLLVLLRPDPVKFGTWSRSEYAITDSVWSTAAALVGALAGFKRLPIQLRNEALVSYFGERSAAELNGDHTGASEARLSFGGARPVEALTRTEGDSEVLALLVGESTLVTRKKAPPTLAEMMASIDLEDEKVSGQLSEVCRLLGWDDCLETTISLPGTEFSARSGRRGSLTIHVTGWAEVSTRVDVPRFKERLSREGIARKHNEAVRGLMHNVLPIHEGRTNALTKTTGGASSNASAT